MNETQDTPMTPESIAQARADQLAERNRVEALTGLRILDSGQPFYSETCQQCGLIAVDDSAARAGDKIARHIVRVHYPHLIREGGQS